MLLLLTVHNILVNKAKSFQGHRSRTCGHTHVLVQKAQSGAVTTKTTEDQGELAMWTQHKWNEVIGRDLNQDNLFATKAHKSLNLFASCTEKSGNYSQRLGLCTGGCHRQYSVVDVQKWRSALGDSF